MEWVSGNVYIRPLGGVEGMAAGETIGGHAHNFDHTTVFFNGRWRVRRGPETLELDTAPGHLLIRAGVEHEITFLGDASGARGQAWCVYSHRDPQGEVSQVRTGWERAYV